MLGLEPIPFGDLGVAGLAASEHTTFELKFWPCGPMDRAIDPATSEKRRVGGVDNGINAQGRDVGNDDFEPGVADRPCGQVQAAVVAGTPLSANGCCNSPAWNISRMMSQPPTNSPFT